jgi:hypothetical protein
MPSLIAVTATPKIGLSIGGSIAGTNIHNEFLGCACMYVCEEEYMQPTTNKQPS